MVVISDEKTAKRGLNMRGYHFTWKDAKRLALRNERSDDARLIPYWERVRLLFLELGGEYEKEATNDPR